MIRELTSGTKPNQLEQICKLCKQWKANINQRQQRSNDETTRYLDIIEWLVRSGADAAQRTPTSSQGTGERVWIFLRGTWNSAGLFPSDALIWEVVITRRVLKYLKEFGSELLIEKFH